VGRGPLGSRDHPPAHSAGEPRGPPTELVACRQPHVRSEEGCIAITTHATAGRHHLRHAWFLGVVLVLYDHPTRTLEVLRILPRGQAYR
jgi:hypothetical protein